MVTFLISASAPSSHSATKVIATQSLFQNVGALIPTLLAGIAADIIGVQRVAIAIAVLILCGAVAALTI